MGGRGQYAERRRLGGDVVNSFNSAAIGGGGGGDGDAEVSMSAGGDAPNLSSYQIVDFNFVNDRTGNMTIKDADGKLHTSNIVESGSTRSTFLFDSFVMKFEGLIPAGVPGQNEADLRAYNSVVKENREFFTKLLTKNVSMNVKVAGVNRKVQVIAAERAVPATRLPTPAEYSKMEGKFIQVMQNKGKGLDDVSFPSPLNREGKGHNVRFVEKSGKMTFQIYDYAFSAINRRRF